jgi:PQ loop repeat
MQVSVGFAMSLGARVPQIWLNHKNGDSGELSLVTCALSFAGNFARLFTTLILTSDLLLFASTLAQCVLNGILTAQCWQTERRARLQKAGAVSQGGSLSPEL